MQADEYGHEQGKWHRLVEATETTIHLPHRHRPHVNLFEYFALCSKLPGNVLSLGEWFGQEVILPTWFSDHLPKGLVACVT